MGDTEFATRTVTTRKPHRCDWCGERTSQGETLKRRAGVYDREFFSCYLHQECFDAMEMLADGETEWFYLPGENPRGGILEPEK